MKHQIIKLGETALDGDIQAEIDSSGIIIRIFSQEKDFDEYVFENPDGSLTIHRKEQEL